MKNFFVVILLIVSSVSINAQDNRLLNFEDMMDAMKSGNTVKAVIYYGQAEMIIAGEESDEKEMGPDAIGGMEFKTWEYFAKGVVRNELAYVAASETVLIGHPFYGYVLNYGKVRIYEDNSAEITVRYLDPNTYEVKMDEKFLTTIFKGEIGAIHLFK